MNGEGEAFGPYRLLELLGRGGMGEVHRAFDTATDRIVALKRLPTGLAADEAFQIRFRREARVAAQLTDPHVIPIHTFGEFEDRLFIDMRLVEGTDLATVLAQSGALNPTRAVDLVSQVAGALDAAHRAGISHRDVKPSNILLGGDRRDFAYLIDFGIASGLQSTRLTGTGLAVGTTAYMAPERFLGNGSGDHRVDVYALGCVLHEMLTGSPPFIGEDVPSLMYAHLENSPPRPSARRTDISPDFDLVIEQALAKDPDRRHASAGEMAAHARAVLRTEQDDTAAITLPATSATSTAGHGDTVANYGTAPRTDSAAVVGPPVRRRTARRIAVAAVLALAAGGGIVTLTANQDSIFGTDTPTAQSVTASIPITRFPVGVTVAPDGRRAYVGSTAPAISVIDTASSTVINTLSGSGVGDGVAVTPDGRRLYASRYNGSSVGVFDTATNAPVATIAVGREPADVAVTPDGRPVYVPNHKSNTLSVIDTGSNTVIATIPTDAGPTSAAASPDGRRVYLTTESGTLSVIDTADNTVTGRMAVSTTPVKAFGVALTPDGKRAYVTTDAAVAVVDTTGETAVKSIPTGYSSGVAVSPDGRRAFAVNYNARTLSIIDTQTDTVTSTVPAGDGALGLALSPDGRRAYVTNNTANSVSVLDLG